MIYLDNAATNGFLSYDVTEAAVTTLKYLTANPGRSGHRLAVKAAEVVCSARLALKGAFNAKNADKVIFTDGCTTALNTAINGTVKKGGNVVTTALEHNSVLRPLFTLEKQGLISLTVIKPDSAASLTEKILRSVTGETYLVAVTGASNVTGETPDITAIGKGIKKLNETRADGNKILFLVDGAQLAGHKKIDVTASDIDLLCLAGHKALGAISGSGALIISEKADVLPTKSGGTGTETFLLTQPMFYPERLEAGSLNLPAIASLKEAAEETEKNAERNGELLLSRTAYLCERLSMVKGIKLYSKPNPCGIVSFSASGTDSNSFADILSSEFDIAVRGGFHCAPLLHKFLKTDKTGLVRASLSPKNSAAELDAFLFAVRSIQSRKG